MQTNDTALTGKNILITRPQQQALDLCELIEQSGGQALLFPVIEIKAVQLDVKQQESALKQIDDSEIIIFISQNAVQHFQQQFTDRLDQIRDKQVFAIGEKTRHCLAKYDINNVLTAAAGIGSEALLELPELAASQIDAKQVLIVKGHGGRELLYETLEERGARIHVLELYMRHRPQTNTGQFNTIWKESRPDSMIFTSGEGIANFLEMIVVDDFPDLYTTPVVVLGERIAALAEKAGFSKVVCVETADDKALLQALYQLHKAEN